MGEYTIQEGTKRFEELLEKGYPIYRYRELGRNVGFERLEDFFIGPSLFLKVGDERIVYFRLSENEDLSNSTAFVPGIVTSLPYKKDNLLIVNIESIWNDEQKIRFERDLLLKEGIVNVYFFR